MYSGQPFAILQCLVLDLTPKVQHNLKYKTKKGLFKHHAFEMQKIQPRQLSLSLRSACSDIVMFQVYGPGLYL